MRLVYFLVIFFCFVQNIASQTYISTSTKATEVTKIFKKGGSIEWAIPISQTEKLSLHWYERQSSFTKKEGIRTFAGYKDDTLVASLSIHNNSVSAEINQSENTIQITTDEQGFLSLHIDDQHLNCGACSDDICLSHRKIKKTFRSSFRKVNEEKKIANRDVLFVYRLAMPISYKYFSDPDQIFKSKIENVKKFWANTETFLNDLYTRDIGVKFEIVDDERLIIKTPDKQPFNIKSSSDLVDASTKIIDSLIGRENYDLGISISNSFNDVAGRAILNAAYGYYKGGATSITRSSTIAHEIGHMFGSSHTHSRTLIGEHTYYTENNRGQSIMSYSSRIRDYFSLVSAHFIRNYLGKLGYYQDKERTKLIKENSDFDHINYPLGIKTPNQAPVIDRSKLKKEYKIPSYTNFQFRIHATDTDDKELLYMAHPADIGKKGHAQFYTYKGTTNNTISFEPSYTASGRFVNTDTRHYVKEGDFVFWLGVNDANPQEEKAVKYDLYETKVKVISGTPFDISSDIKSEYKVGEKLVLKWNVDDKIFDSNSKVRILLSDDLGKTYKHTIVESTKNDGEYEFTIPNILIGETKFGNSKGAKIPAGVFKVEVIDHIAYAKTNTIPYKDINHELIPYGGFKIVPNDNSPIPPLQFTGSLPKNITVSCSKNIPEKEDLQVMGGCNPKVEVSDVIKNQTCTNSYTIERTYTASDTCGSTSITHTQIITIKDEQAPVFNETLPTDISVEEDKIPAQADLTATDNCSANVAVVKSQETKQEGNDKIIIYKWEATDECGNKNTHQQRVRVTPSKIKFIGDLPQNITISCEKPIPNAPTLQVSGSCNTKVVYNGETKSAGNCKNNYTITRTWTASNDCGESISHTQIITIKDEQAPIFNGTLPTDISVTEDKIPAQVDLTATDNCSTNISVSKLPKQEITENGNKVIIYKWEAIDECGNKAEHTQRINILANEDSQKTTLYPNPIKEFAHIKTNEKVLEIKIYDYSGRLIKTLPSKSNNVYNVSFLTTGNYIFVVKTTTGSYNFKILKM